MTTPEFEFSHLIDRLDDLDFVLKLTAYHQGKLEGYRKWKVEKMRWVTHPEDSKSGVCADCEPLDGVLFDVEDVDEWQLIHPFCVCTVEPEEE